MTRRSERRWPLIVVGYAGLVVLVALVAVPAYVLAAAPHRATVLRVAAAIVAGIGLRHLLRSGEREPDGTGPSDRTATAPPPALARPFLDLRGEVSAGLQSQAYFERILWPRLARLLPGRPTAPRGRALGRGPSIRSLRELVAAAEEQSR